MNREFVFGNVNLNALDGITITKIVPEPVDRETSTTSLVLADGSATTSQLMRKRIIRLEGHILGNTVEEGESRYDTFMGHLQGINKTIKFAMAGVNRFFTGSVATVIEEDRVGSYKAFKILFECPDPFGYSESYYSTTESGITGSEGSFAVTVNGTYRALPIITLEINSITIGTGGRITITIGNSTIAISRTWEANDILVINTEEKSIEVNSEPVLWSGVLPTLQTGTETIYYQDDFTARNVDIQVQYKARFL